MFREISHVKKLEFKTFCKTIDKIKEAFSFHNVDVESFACWSKIKLLQAFLWVTILFPSLEGRGKRRVFETTSPHHINDPAYIC